MDDKRELGPSAKKLLTMFMSREAIPNGGGLADGARFFLDAEHRKSVMDRAKVNFDAAIQAVRSAPDNPYGNDEEVIANAILSEIEKR